MTRRNPELREALRRGTGREFAVLAAVEPVDSQPYQQPSEKAEPGQDWEPGHEQRAKDHTEHWRGNSARSSEAPVAPWVAVSKNNNPKRHQHKSEERTDVRQIRKRTDVQNTRGNADNKSGDPGGS